MLVVFALIKDTDDGLFSDLAPGPRSFIGDDGYVFQIATLPYL